MKNFLNFTMAILILSGVFLFGMTTGSMVFASTLTISVAAFSAIKQLGNFKGAFNTIEIPDFTEKSKEDILEMGAEDRLKYFEERKAFEDAKNKAWTQEQIEAIKTEQAEGYEEKIKELNDKLEKSILDTEKAYGMIAAMQEKGNNGKNQEDNDISKALSKRIEKLKAGEIKKGDAPEEVVIKAAALMTTANVIPNVTSGFNQLLGNNIEEGIIDAPKDRPFIMSIVDTQVTEGADAHWYVQRINEEGDAAFIGEGDAKPLTDGEWKEYKADVKEVAEFWKMSERLIMHAPSVVSDFRQHAQELIELQMDGGVLSGDGTGDNLSGITNEASAFVVPSELANYYPDPNIYDVTMAVATYVRLNNFKGNLTCVLNTVWKAKMAGIKNADNDYILPPFVTRDGKKVGEVTVRFENALADTHILLGDFNEFRCRISENIKYSEGWVDDDFRKNLVSRRLAAFLSTFLPSNRSGAIIYDSIATIETAIAEPT